MPTHFATLSQTIGSLPPLRLMGAGRGASCRLLWLEAREAALSARRDAEAPAVAAGEG